MAGSPSIYTQKGIAALKAGNSNLARRFFDAALDDNPNDELAWLWLSGVVHTPDEKRECLKRVLAINPNNAAAKRGLDILGPEPVAPLASFPAEPVESATPPMAVKPVEPARPLPQGRGKSKRGGQSAILIALGIGVIGVFGLLVAALATQSREGPPAAQGGPIVTPGRLPPTWTPTPTNAPTPTPTPRAAPTQLQPLVEAAIRARELEPIASIHYVLSAQFDIDLYLRNDIDAQSVVLANTFWDEMRALGLVDFELEYDRQRIIDLTSRQLAGFYSPTDKTLYAVTQSSRVDPGEYVVIVHEYVHALTDMHFDLGRLLYAERTTDSDLAARALAEGDATLAENSSPWVTYSPEGW
ncbi:MAG: tetratricopeptide repeat protein, partial [Anaerolineae bacterium]